MKKLFFALIGSVLLQYGSFSQCCSQYGPELIYNGDFETGGATIPTTYNNNVPSYTSGDYGLVTTAGAMLGAFIDCPSFGDHTAAGTNFLIFNQSAPATTPFLNYTSIPVTGGQTYTIQYYVCPDFAGNSYYFDVNILINGSVVQSTDMNSFVTGCLWRKVCFDWTAPALATSVSMGLQYSSTGSGTHYFGIDDVSFRKKLVVTATQPVVNVCSDDPPFNLGANHVPTGNVYWTNGYFTPVDGFPGGIGASSGGSFTILPPVNINSFPPNELIEFDPSIGAGSYTVEYTYTDTLGGCSESAIMVINVFDSPAVTATQPTVNLCTSDSPITIGALYDPNGNVYWTNGYFTPVDGFSGSIPPPGGSFSILPAGITTAAFPPYTLYQFDPSTVSPGAYTVEYTYTNPVSGCSGSATMDFVVSPAQWHQTTSNATAFPNSGDKGFDIFTDDDYVYATGRFQGETTFDDGLGNSITITSGQPDLTNFYAVCHNKCGELQWVIYDADGSASDNWSEGFGINKQGDEILIGFNYNRQTELLTVYPGGPTVSSAFNGSLGGSTIGNLAVIAVDGPLSSSFGEVNAIEDSYGNYFGTALDVQENGSLVNVYISGKSDTDANYLSKVFASRLDYNFGANSFATNWINNSLQESNINVANDIIWEDRLGGVLITGTFDQTLTINATTIVSGALRDAFWGWLDPATGAIFFSNLHAFGATSGYYAEGTCLTSDNNNYIYFGGDYQGDVSNVFSGFLGGAGALGFNSLSNSSYVCSYDINGVTLGVNEIFNPNSYTHLTGMDANSTKLAFIGYYDRGLPQISGTTSMAATNVGGSYNYTFFGETTITSSTWSNQSIVNSTQDIPSPMVKYDHISSRISLGNDYAYATGTYKGNMDYYNGSPVSGVLLSSGVNLDPYNAFILREDLSTNELRIAEKQDDVQEKNSDLLMNISLFDKDDVSVNVYPNPTNGLFNLQINGYQINQTANMQIFNLQGEEIVKMQLGAAQNEIDLSQFENGIYLLTIQFENEIKTVRITKQ